MKNEIILRRIAVLLVVSGWALGAVITAQEPGAAPPSRNGGGQFAGMQRVAGEVTAVSGTTLTVKTEEGATLQIVTTDNTRVMKGRGTAVKVAELKVGDGVTAAGNMDAPNKTLHAAMVFAVDAADVKKLKDNLGKTYITGKVTAIDLDDAKMTVERPDHVSQTIAFDETTSFKRGRGLRVGGGAGFGGGAGAGSGASAGNGPESGESITLADIKVGDNVAGQGSLKSGTFVPAQLMVATPGQGGPGQGGRRRSGTPATPGAAPNPAPAPGPGPVSN
jgi:predicted RNA-binding protein